MRRRNPAVPLFLAAAGLGLVLVGYGISRNSTSNADNASLIHQDVSAPAPASTAPTVKGGSGVWTGDAAPVDASAESSAPCPNCDIVVITMCSLRQDYVSAYGVHPGLTPRIDSLGDGGYRFTQAYAASNFTLAGLTAVLTGRYGSTTGVTGWDKGLVADVPTLPEILGHYGYHTAAFTIDAPSGFRPDYGLQRGFERMEILPPPRDTPDGRTGAGKPGPGGDSARPVAAWLAEQPTDHPIFAMFHSRTAHFPFVLEPPTDDPTGVLQALYDAGQGQKTDRAMPGTAGGTSQRGVVELGGPDPVQVAMKKAGAAGDVVWREAYARAVARADVDVGVVLDAIAARGRPTVVLLVADHGESLNDHGELLHGDAYWDTVVRVPLLMRIPGMSGGTVDSLVSHVDLLPTLLRVVGAMPPAGIDGTSLLPLLNGETDTVRGTTLVEGGVAWRDEAVPRGAVIAPPWALLRQDRGCNSADTLRKPGEPASCLYDMVADPGQEKNVAAQHADTVKELLERWDSFRAARAGQARQLELDPAYVEELHRTGYDFRVGGK